MVDHQVYVLDIEGTVCPISFVKDELFPFFLAKIPSILAELEFPLKPGSKGQGGEINEICAQFPGEVTCSHEDLANYIENLVKNDVKDPVLKSLQGLVWRLGYEQGELCAPVYNDAVEFIGRVWSLGKKTYIYSSGSIGAQKLLFGHVKSGDKGTMNLNPQLAGYFDISTSGFKNEARSYTNILESIGLHENPGLVLFLSDNVLEVEAALQAGMQSYVVQRPGNAPLSDHQRRQYKVINNFGDIN